MLTKNAYEIRAEVAGYDCSECPCSDLCSTGKKCPADWSNEECEEVNATEEFPVA